MAQKRTYKKKRTVHLTRMSEVEKLPINTQQVNALKRDGIYDIDDLLEYTASELVKLPNIGGHSVSVIEKALANSNLALKKEDDAGFVKINDDDDDGDDDVVDRGPDRLILGPRTPDEEIEIIVRGRQGSGKSTIMGWIKAGMRKMPPRMPRSVLVSFKEEQK